MLIQILLIGVSVSMDAFAVSIGKGLTVKKLRGLDALKTALWFGGFQALFPLLGYFAASTFSKYVTAVDHWIIFGLLALIGGNMVREAFEEDEENAKETPEFDWKHMLPLAVACSIDAFAVGVSFAFMTLNIWLSVVIIGITTGLFSAAGLTAFVYGPGDIAQAHAPDEFIELEQIALCEDFVDRVIAAARG